MSNYKAKELAEVSEVERLLREDVTPWYKKKNLTLLYLTLVPSALGVEMTTGYDGSIMNGLQSVDTWLEYFNQPNGAILGLLSASLSIGSLLIIPITPYVCETFGRRKSVIFGSIVIVIGIILQTASVNIAMFVVARIILGAGIVPAVTGASQLIAELAYPKERSVLTGLFNESWYAGAILAAGVTLGTFAWPSNWSWRLPSLLQLLPSMLQLAFIWFVPESPRWLVSKDRTEDALKILIKYHAEGNEDSQFVAAEFAQICDTIKMEYESNKHPWKEFVSTKANLHRLLIAACVGLFVQWSGNGLVSYYLSKVLATVGIHDRREQNTINLGLMCWNLVTGCIAAVVTKYMRRRVQYLTAFTMMTICFACWTGASASFTLTGNSSAAIAVVAMIWIYYSFYNLMMPLTYIYMTEIFPFIYRSKGISFQLIFNKGATAFNQFVNPIGLQRLGYKFYIVYCVWLVIETVIIYFLYPETKGPSLEEIAAIFEGSEAKVDFGMQDIKETEAFQIERV
ncbi:MFS sugar:H+ symporter [Lipomyces arxii]|uniref:MFS sugar:H+ symporter n=1 Tax=Lipomyces arxii TaxID=56418 RepID=UPI0034CE6546